MVLAFGPLRPVGLVDPRTGKEAYAVVQLRQDNAEGTLYNLVGFQTRLKWPEQKRIFGMIPGLENAEYARYGVMHRNTFLNAPELLDGAFRMKSRPTLLFAGQMTGVEGYMESAAAGILAGLNACRMVRGQEPLILPRDTMMGALAAHVSTPNADYQPMGANFGILPTLENHIRDKKMRYAALAQRALDSLDRVMADMPETIQAVNEEET
jgi:methylenetetrahydrofolate--tRNA-(uracil-5-)-methyltransferase